MWLQCKQALANTYGKLSQSTRLILYKADKSMVVCLQKSQDKGEVSSDIDLKESVDSFTGMLFHGTLRFSDIFTTLNYSRE
ncbi:MULTISPECIES: hypothetical protein [unclassified Nostoc]|uniref:hypothetical protein n=1 Tax=unclassified Nostoc TaxID=2593658 RepID=UPI0025FB582D|nr:MULTISPECIES: hypothetical protein [unclassified Nostoc]